MAKMTTVEMLTALKSWIVTKLGTKQDTLTFDTTPTANSSNPVTSGGIHTAISGFITNSVNNLVNYYLKSETYTKSEVEALIAAINQFHYEIAESTSAVTSPQSNVLYLIGPTGSGSDMYEEYVYPNSTTGWTKIGDTSIDLSGYVTTTALNTALADYTTTANLTTLLNGKVDKVSGKGLSTNDYTTEEKTKLGALPTNSELTTALNAKEATTNKVTTVNAESTDAKYPSAKGVWTAITSAITAAIATVKEWANDIFFVKGTYSASSAVGLSDNISSWEGEAMSRDYVQTAYVETTGGDISIDSSLPANLKSVVPTTDFFASQLISTGFNLLRRATAVGDGWYFEVPHLVATQQSIGTALQNNGVLFTSSTHENLTPTVYFKPLASGVPESVTDGTAATYTDKDGRRHYTTSGAGYLIVSGIDRASVCAHIGWSRRYDEYISVADEADAGAVVDMAAGIHALHSYDKMLVIGAVADRIERTGENQITWTRRLDRVQPTWTDTPVLEDDEPTGQYLHEADISAMKAGGAAQFETANIGLAVEGTKVSYTDSNATASTDYVKYELAAEVTGTAAVSSTFACEDWGLIILKGATGTAEVVLDYAQNVPDNLRTSLPIINDLHHCTGSISQGYGVCVNGTYEKDKTVYIQHFLLLQGGVIHVLFTTPINTERTSLNVSGTGAKPVRILGQNLPAGVVKAQTYATLAYDGAAWNIVDMFCPDASFDPAELVVDMGLTSGVKWAARDLDLTKPGGFCDTPFTYDKSFFSWGNIDGHNPKSNSFAGVYNWGSVNAAEPWYEGQPYGSTKGNTLAGDIPVGEEFDAARANLGSPWRMPTTAEFEELFAGSIYIDATGTEIPAATTDKRVTVNGIVGLYLQSKTNGNRLFFSASGYGNGSSWDSRGASGYYWSASFLSSRNARRLSFDSVGVYPQSYYNRCNGFAVRAVQS